LTAQQQAAAQTPAGDAGVPADMGAPIPAAVHMRVAAQVKQLGDTLRMRMDAEKKIVSDNEALRAELEKVKGELATRPTPQLPQPGTVQEGAAQALTEFMEQNLGADLGADDKKTVAYLAAQLGPAAIKLRQASRNATRRALEDQRTINTLLRAQSSIDETDELLRSASGGMYGDGGGRAGKRARPVDDYASTASSSSSTAARGADRASAARAAAATLQADPNGWRHPQIESGMEMAAPDLFARLMHESYGTREAGMPVFRDRPLDGPRGIQGARYSDLAAKDPNDMERARRLLAGE
jgi:hypothetical protein